MEMRLEELFKYFQEAAEHPGKLKDQYIRQGKKVIACFPYYVPEELIFATGMVPMGLWGCKGAPVRAKEYFPTFFCSVAQMGMEMVLNGTLAGISGVVCPSICDTLRPLTQNLKSAGRYPVIFLAHPQNRKKEYGVGFCRFQYENMRQQLEEIAGSFITDESIHKAIHIYNENRAACRRFVRLAGLHPETVSAVMRSRVLKARHFMEKPEHTRLLTRLNEELERLPIREWDGTRVVLSGILADHENFLKLFDNYKIAVAADDLAHESRGFLRDAMEEGDPMEALARQFSSQDNDTILYDSKLNGRPEYIIRLVKESKAQGVVVAMMSFCDPEELEYPSLKQRLDTEKIPSLQLGYDHQMTDFGQAETALQAFKDVLEMRK